MTNTDKRCGTCRHHGAPVFSGSSQGRCEWVDHLTDGIAVPHWFRPKRPITRTTDGCSAWEAK